MALGLFLTGCLSRPALVRHSFALQNPPAVNTPAAPGASVLALQTVDVSPLFAGRSLVYRTGPDTYEVDPYAGFLILPGRTLTIPVRIYLRNTGLFQAVIEPGSPIPANQSLAIEVTELYGDFTRRDQPAAVLSLRLLLLDATNGGAGKVLLQKNYSRHAPLKQNTAIAVVAGYDQALAEIMAEVSADLAALAAGRH
jgi:ABC-type uncharacterized transport system auxiliary subunit